MRLIMTSLTSAVLAFSAGAANAQTAPTLDGVLQICQQNVAQDCADAVEAYITANGGDDRAARAADVMDRLGEQRDGSALAEDVLLAAYKEAISEVPKVNVNAVTEAFVDATVSSGNSFSSDFNSGVNTALQDRTATDIEGLDGSPS